MTPDSDIQTLYGLCADTFGVTPSRFEKLPGGGGDRIYYRLFFSFPVSACGKQITTILGVKADNKNDAQAFIGLSEVFGMYGVSVPCVPAHTRDFSYYLVEDLGDKSLFASLGEKDIENTLQDVMKNLVRMQTTPRKAWEDLVAYRPFSRRQALWDLNYFKYEYLRPSSVDFDEERLEDDFEAFADSLLETDGRLWGFMMRDCQSRNIMLDPDPVFIDYQGGRLGPCIYDAISFLWQAKAGFSTEVRQRLLDAYAREFGSIAGVQPEEILSYVPRFALFRTLQVLGAYGFRGLVQKRAHFIESIPGALCNLRSLLDDGTLDAYLELKRVAGKLITDPRFDKKFDGKLHVKVFSFSYKKGYPEDYSGNGGGFMFDCRGMHNPGRYEEYKPLTGRDRPVIDFLESRGEAACFINKAMDIVSPSVERYRDRGFDSLQIGFGCTGGRHRSVYCAESVALRLAEKYPGVTVELIHREQNINQTFNSES